MIEPSKEKKRVGRDAPHKAAFDPNGPIGRKLKSFYDVIETEPVPDRILDLLGKLDEAEEKAKSGS
ncbi:NepR family anti-sigma factor [Shinella sp.]|uniref:NepR family anti-sigma factor n=1 Tax=Shinella sp. TaxID=1870904 RepID=UPI003F70E6FC